MNREIGYKNVYVVYKLRKNFYKDEFKEMYVASLEKEKADRMAAEINKAAGEHVAYVEEVYLV